MYEKDGEKYFIVDEHQHFWNARPDNWVEGRENLAKGWIDCFYGYHQLGPPETHWDSRSTSGGPSKTTATTCSRRATSTTRSSSRRTSSYWYKEGFNTTKRNRHGGRGLSRARSSSTAGGTRVRARRAPPVRGETTSAYNYKGVKLYTAEWYGNSRGYKVSDPEAYRYLEQDPGAGHQERAPAQGPHDLAAGQGRVRRRGRRQGGDGLPRAQLHRRARGRAADRAVRLHRGAGAQRVRGPVRGDRCPHARPSEHLREVHGRAAVLGGRRPHRLRQRLRHLGAEVAGRGLHRLADARRASSSPTTRSSPPPPRRRSWG